MMKRLALTLTFTLLTAVNALAANFIESEDLKKLIDQKQELILVDIQPAADFEKHHLPGSIETNAFPAKTAEEKARLDKVLPMISQSKALVIVICPRGKSGAKNSYDYLLSKGVAEDRIKILEDGIHGWEFEDMLVTGR